MRSHRILITGASGFLGGRLVERLFLAEKATVRAMAHKPMHAARLARLPVEISWCDITDAEQVKRSMEGCDIVVNCAYGATGAVSDNRRVTVGGTRHLAEAALKAGVEKFVHVSSIAVHSYSPAPGTTEDSPYLSSGDNYCKDKIDAERAVMVSMERGLPAVVLRMGNMYGPFSVPWVIRPLTHILERKICLVDGGHHASNMVFVDNAVEAILLSIREESAIGKTFFIIDDPLTWAELYGHYVQWLGINELRSITSEELDSLMHPSWSKRMSDIHQDLWTNVTLPIIRYALFKGATSPYLSKMASAIWKPVPQSLRLRILGDMQGKSVPAPLSKSTNDDSLPPLGLLQVYAGRAALSNQRAKDILGFGPRVSFSRAIEVTHQWAQWARLLPTHN